MTPAGLPALDRPLGSLDHPLRDAGVADDAPFELPGRRASVTGRADRGIQAVRAGPAVLRTVRVRGATARSFVISPLGLERALSVDGIDVVERVVVSRDAPVCWVEWSAEPGTVLEVECGLEEGWTARSGDRWVECRTDGHAGHAGHALLVLGHRPEGIRVGDDPAGPVIRTRLVLPDGGVRLAVIGIGPDDDRDRLLRVAGRTGVAVRAREGAASRVLGTGLRVRAPEPLAAAVDRARVRLDAGGLGLPDGAASPADTAARGMAHLVVGSHDPVRNFLRRLADRVDRDDQADRSDGAGATFLALAARYLAWSGDRATLGGIWPAVTAVAETCTEEAVLAEVVVAAEELGDDDLADRLRAAPRVVGPAATGGAGPAAQASPAAILCTLVLDILGAEPHATRGRLGLRPRPGRWELAGAGLEVTGLTVGSAAVDLRYERRGAVHRLTVWQTRGGPPVQVALEPELPGQKIAATRVDGAEAELDAVVIGDRCRVPVQLVLDTARTLEVEFAEGEA